MIRVLADCHHGDLFESLRILFEDRLGWALYRPIGLEWYSQGYWNVYDHIDTAKQYLDISDVCPQSIHGALVTNEHGENAWLNKHTTQLEDGVYVIYSPNHGGRWYKGITLDKVRSTPIDIFVSSLPQHFPLYEKLRKETWPNAKHIFQVGNHGWKWPAGMQNLLNSTTMPAPAGVNAVHYHQEFCLKEFCFTECKDPRVVTNLMHYQQHHYAPLFLSLSFYFTHKGGWKFLDHGAGNEDGPVDDVAETIKNSGFIFHCKRGGDGYGYNIHNAFACGRPMIIKGDQHRGQTAAPLFEHGKTVIDTSVCELPSIIKLLEDAADNYPDWSRRAYERFRNVVDFDAEFDNIQKFLERLQ